MTKQEIKQLEEKLLEMTNTFCTQQLNEDYRQLCEKLIRKLGRKKVIPFQKGKPEVWASAVVYALGSINFLFDKSSEPYMETKQICEYFGTNNSTVSKKASDIKKMFKMSHFNPEFSTQKMAAENPLNNMVVVDGFIVPLDTLPAELQQQVKEARASGLDIEFRTK